MQLDILSEVSQKEKGKYHDISYMWNLRYGINEPMYKIEADSQTENRLVVAMGVGGGSGMYWEFGASRCKLLHLEWIYNKGPPYSTGNYVPSPGIDHNGKEYKKITYVCVYG